MSIPYPIPSSKPPTYPLSPVHTSHFKREDDGCLYAADDDDVGVNGGGVNGGGATGSARFRPQDGRYNLGTFIASRIEELGVKDYFAIPGDFNLILLDQIILNPNIRMIGCCNELNMGYAADGYARQYGVAVAFVTLNVGGLSLANAISGAMAEDVPIIVISGGAHTNDYVNDNLVHHSTNQKNKNQCLEVFKQITCKAVRIDQAHNAEAIITDAFETALRKRQPVYIEICHNLATASPIPPPTPMCIEPGPIFNAKSLRASSNAIVDAFNAATTPLLMFGARALAWSRQVDGLADRKALLDRLAAAVGCGHVVQPGAKGLLNEQAEGYMGVYWGHVSIKGCQQAVEDADLVLAIGTHWDDVSTCGYSLQLDTKRILSVDEKSGVLPCHDLSALLTELIHALKVKSRPNAASLAKYKEDAAPNPALPLSKPSKDPLTRHQIMNRLQAFVKPNHTLLADAGDNWFNLMAMDLPNGAQAFMQLSYASIGWSLPAVLGASLAGRHSGRRSIVLVGDGAAQMTIQEISTIVRYRANPIIILFNNFGYQIEEVLHAGPYNLISNWQYHKLVDCFTSTTDRESADGVVSALATTEDELCQALVQAETGKSKDRLVFIETRIRPNDVSDLLLRFGVTAGKWNGRPMAAGLNEGFQMNLMVGL